MIHSPSPDPDDAARDPETDTADAGEQRIGELERQLADAREDVLRTHAEMDNVRKRLARELETTRRYAAERVLADLVPVIDSLDQGLGAIAENDPSREGLALTRQQLLAALEKHGLAHIDPIGQVFDPAEHQAISMQPSDSQPDNTVLTVLQKGYRLHERVLRPAMVIVAQGTPD